MKREHIQINATEITQHSITFFFFWSTLLNNLCTYLPATARTLDWKFEVASGNENVSNGSRNRWCLFC